MPDADGSSKPPQISDMFQKFAQAFKSKTFEFFTEIEPVEDSDVFSLLDSAEEVITDQKVVVIKPDPIYGPSVPEQPSLSPPRSVMPRPLSRTQNKTINTRITQTLISSIFATVSSFEASYFQLQAAHVPFAEENVKDADRALVSHLQRLSEFKQFYKDCCRNQDFGDDLPIGSCLEARVEENQSKLRILGNVSNRLQSEIDQKDNQVLALKKKLGEIQKSNFELSKRATHRFTKILIELMRKAMWDLGLAANSVYSDIEYAKEGHSRYAFMSYVSLLMFKGFDLDGFGVGENEIVCNGHVLNSEKNSSSLKQLLEHVSSNPVELLSMNRKCEFARFCETKYQELIHPTMESSIFSNLDRNETILNSWKSLSVFYDSFVRMASAIWTLHKLAFSFDPVVEIFKVERGTDFSMVYMEDVTRRCMLPCKTRAKVGCTVVPGFKIGRTIIQSQVYLSGLKFRE
ncbi:hypothetical protein I3760_14G029000 [Carya illinoinensis]|uniref:DUF641 domain-containing protein n=1 Tax=Carya illinoinensis TaxID=32201 RepID=A0A8T1NAB4_CARIL|nr:hypothetical protein I3760_14G029000 [Carya illinoinensis]KAG2669323.1 hypothetical protein I3760_14G029000 [Carya illinoinensis]KAG6628629.1 hypothetical protein CIPAW_14G026500 [Carya illinoinensis]KAG6677481.1 hypothetical protein I3842_14G029200 [Carya illinoinensis]